ncbi:MAG: UPF0175 family protein [Verrucomicrobia bacterium]|jgi:predicted HTH domain antitoxin|nr:UPF0175 family protein [Verrucomicrobiota bacterium]
MIITLPDDPALRDLSEEDIRIDLACGLFSSGRVSRTVAARMAGLDRLEMDRELTHRHISGLDEESLDQDLHTLNSLFPR